MATLRNQEFVQFFADNSQKADASMFDETEEEPRKLFARDTFEDTFSGIDDLVAEGQDLLVIANASGADTILSFAGGLAEYANVELLVVDSYIGYLRNFLFRVALLQLNTSPVEYVKDLFGVDDDALVADFLKGDAASAKRLASRPFDPDAHASNLYAKLRAARGLSNEYIDLVSEAVRDVGSYIHAYDQFSDFVQGVFGNVTRNKKTYYLTSKRRFDALRKIVTFPNGKQGNGYAVHMINQNMARAAAVGKVRKIVRDYFPTKKGENPINFIFVPDPVELTGAVPFIADNADFVVTRNNERDRVIVVADATELVPTSHQVAGLGKYKKLQRQRKPIKGLADAPVCEGLERTLFMTHLEIGSIYSDEAAIEDMIDIANGRGATLWVTSAALFGPKIYRGKKERQLLDPEYASLDAQLRKFMYYVERFNGNVIYVLSPVDWENMVDLKTIFIKELNARKTGKIQFDLNISQREQDFLTQFEEPGRVIVQHYYPTLLRLGEDPGLYTEEVNVEGGAGHNNVRYMTREGISIVDMVRAMERRANQKAPTGKDREVFAAIERGWENNPKLSVFDDYSGFDHLETGTGAKGERPRPLRVFPDTRMTGKTAYTKPFQTLAQIMCLRSGGTLDVAEPIVVDVQQFWQLIRMTSTGVALSTSHMVDDRRYFDANFSTAAFKRTPGSHVHKRCTKPKPTINIPSATLVSGHPEKRLAYEMYPPMVVDQVRKRAKDKGLRDVSICVYHDTQLGNYTERLAFQVKAMDYAFHERGCSCYLGLGDRGHGWNYRDFPLDASPGFISISAQKKAIVELSRPYFTLPQVRLWGEVEGNHEKNSDWGHQGRHYMDRIEEALKTHCLESGHEIALAFPQWLQLKNGDLVRAPFGFARINGYNVAFAHKFHAHKNVGSLDVPVEIAADWKRFMGSTVKDVDICLAAHYHRAEVLQEHNTLFCMLGGQAGNSGYEFERQFTSEPTTTIMTIEASGVVRFEFLPDSTLEGYAVKNPVVKKRGLDEFIQDAISVDVHPFHTEDVDGMQEFLVREPVLKDNFGIE